MKKLVMIAISAILLVACCGEKKDGLVGTSWLLVELNGQPVDRAGLDNKESYTVNFEQDSTGVRVYGVGDANRFFGMPIIDAKNETIVLGNMGMTRMMSPNQQREDEYVKALSDTKSYKLKSGSLVFMNGDEMLLKFIQNKNAE